ncbi:MAG: LemA family protein [Bacteroides sp.]|nr:LemA family protein [Roseburia sp.]MCM1346569.1 LemA family protein [Bacteroides sp.]MCM1420553.1 LemA family protein [Bacteroides sp.]
MKKSTIIVIAVLAIVVIWAISGYNGLVSGEETVGNAWANVEASYQRRADLIPQLVNTVKGYAKHEKSTLEEVVAARSKATQMTVSVDDLSEESIRNFQQMQGEVGTALGRLIAISENYPELKANENFSELQAQLEGTENRINESRKAYNASVKAYNVSVRRFPNNILASIFGFDRKAEFKAAEGAEKAPEVNFD